MVDAGLRSHVMVRFGWVGGVRMPPQETAVNRPEERSLFPAQDLNLGSLDEQLEP